MLLEILAEKRKAVIDQWRQAIIDSYPGDASQFLEKQKDQFANPVGHSIHRDTEVLIDQLIGEMDAKPMAQALDNLVRVRAVQQFKPSEAVAFVTMLKPIVRRIVAQEPIDQALVREAAKLDERIDSMTMMAFDIYTGCRERLAEIRVNETKRAHAKMLERLTGQLPPVQKKDTSLEDI